MEYHVFTHIDNELARFRVTEVQTHTEAITEVTEALKPTGPVLVLLTSHKAST